MKNFVIRKANAADAPLILKFVTQLATYERLRHEVIANEQNMINTLFCDSATAHAVICEMDAHPIGFAVYFYNYSTWLGKNGLYLEDLYVSPEYRGTGAGKALLKYLAQTAVDNDCGRFEWSVLDWNEPAIQFYKSMGAEPLNEWVIYRLAGRELEAFAADKG